MQVQKRLLSEVKGQTAGSGAGGEGKGGWWAGWQVGIGSINRRTRLWGTAKEEAECREQLAQHMLNSWKRKAECCDPKEKVRD